MNNSSYRLPFRSTKTIARRHAPFHRHLGNARYCIDWAMPEDTPVLAAREGTVVSLWSQQIHTYLNPKFARRGNYVLIRHQDGQESLYVHLAWRSVCVRVGQRVRRGQVIARSGQTGYATYPHLHFGVFSPKGTNIRPRWSRTIPHLRRLLTVRGAR